MTDWMLRGACRGEGVDPDWWDNIPSLAMHVCRTHCEVRGLCDEWASGRQWHGLVVGGWLRPDGFHGVRAQKQPEEKLAGCPTCAPTAIPKAATGKRGPQPDDKVPCPRCERPTRVWANGRLAPHNSSPGWRCA